MGVVCGSGKKTHVHTFHHPKYILHRIFITWKERYLHNFTERSPESLEGITAAHLLSKMCESVLYMIALRSQSNTDVFHPTPLKIT